jgi:hypothetical protein
MQMPCVGGRLLAVPQQQAQFGTYMPAAKHIRSIKIRHPAEHVR